VAISNALPHQEAITLLTICFDRAIYILLTCRFTLANKENTVYRRYAKVTEGPPALDRCVKVLLIHVLFPVWC